MTESALPAFSLCLYFILLYHHATVYLYPFHSVQIIVKVGMIIITSRGHPTSVLSNFIPSVL